MTVKAQYACVNEDKPDDHNREFLLKHVCTALNQTCHAGMVGAPALLIGSGHTCASTTIKKSAMNQNEGLAVTGVRNAPFQW